MKTKIFLTYLLIGFQTILFAQNKLSNKAYANITFGHAPDCVGYSGACTFTATQNKTSSNAEVSYNKANKELILTLSKSYLDNNNKAKVLSNELEKDIFLYDFKTDFVLSNELMTALNINGLTKIKQGNYLVRVVDDAIIIKLKLE